jgi:hypothetical protein
MNDTKALACPSERKLLFCTTIAQWKRTLQSHMLRLLVEASHRKTLIRTGLGPCSGRPSGLYGVAIGESGRKSWPGAFLLLSDKPYQQGPTQDLASRFAPADACEPG